MLGTPRRTRRSPRLVERVVVNPFASGLLAYVTLALLGVVVADPTSDSWATRHLGRSGPADVLRPPRLQITGWFVREGEPIRRINPDNESWDEATRLIEERPGDVLTLVYTHSVTRSGFWAPTGEQQSQAIAPGVRGLVGRNFTAAQHLEARRRFADDVFHAFAGSESAKLTAFRESDVSSSRVLWRGYLVNTLTLVASIMLLYSLRWVPQVPARVRARRRARSLASGVCPRCGYSIAGLPEPKCPECGQALDAAQRQS